MAFKIADGYVEVHGRHDRNSTRRNAKQAVDDSERIARDREGSMLKWLFKTNPKLVRLLEAPIGHIFGSPIIFAAAATAALGMLGFLATAVTTALLTGIAAGFVGLGAMMHKKVLEAPWNKMVTEVEGVFTRASKPIVEPLIRAINMIGPAFKKMEPTLTRIYEALAPLIEPFTGGMLGFIEAMLPGIERAMPGIQTAVLALAKHMPSLGTAIGDFFATLAENGPLLERVVGLMILWLSMFFKVAGPILVFWMNGFAFWSDAFTGMMTGIKAGMKWLAETWAKIPGWWDASWGAVSGFFSDLGSSIGGFFSGIWSTISGWWGSMTTAIPNWWNSTWGAVTNFFAELPGKIGGFLSSLPGVLYGWFLAAFDAVTYFIGFALGSWVKMMIGFVVSIPKILQGGWDLVTQGISTAWNWITNFFTVTLVNLRNRVWNFVTSLDELFIRMSVATINTVRSWYNKVLSFFIQLPGNLANAAKSAWNSVIDWFKWGLTSASNIVTNLRSRVLGIITGLGAMMFNAGRDAIKGLINGIGSLMSWAVDMAWRAAKNIAKGFMDALGIGSPSKVMAEQVGKWIPKGIAVGIDANMGDLERQAGILPDMFTGARPPIGGAAPAADSAGGGVSVENLTLQVSIDKIQELKDIEAFLDGKLSGVKANSWAGNIYEKTGEYERSHR